MFAELKRLRVQFAQGYYIARPAPIAGLKPGPPSPAPMDLAADTSATGSVRTGSPQAI